MEIKGKLNPNPLLTQHSAMDMPCKQKEDGSCMRALRPRHSAPPAPPMCQDAPQGFEMLELDFLQAEQLARVRHGNKVCEQSKGLTRAYALIQEIRDDLGLSPDNPLWPEATMKTRTHLYQLYRKAGQLTQEILKLPNDEDRQMLALATTNAFMNVNHHRVKIGDGSAAKLDFTHLQKILLKGMFPEIAIHQTFHFDIPPTLPQQLCQVLSKARGTSWLTAATLGKALDRMDVQCLVAKTDVNTIVGFALGHEVEVSGKSIFYLHECCRLPGAAQMNVIRLLANSMRGWAWQRNRDLQGIALHVPENAPLLKRFFSEYSSFVELTGNGIDPHGRPATLMVLPLQSGTWMEDRSKEIETLVNECSSKMGLGGTHGFGKHFSGLLPYHRHC